MTRGAPYSAAAPDASRAAKIAEIDERLQQEYGAPERRAKLPPLDELILTILSQHTSDANSDRAFASLKAAFASWEEVRDASVAEIRDGIKSAGLASVKAPRIKDLLMRISLERGRLDLDFLREMPMEDAREYLLGMYGVGPKTAACVLLFSCELPAFPVDTHIHRVAGRLGLIGEKVSADEAHSLLEAAVPPDRVFDFHVNLIRHGRRVCKAQRPLCHVCVVAGQCDYYAKNIAPSAGDKEHSDQAG